VKIFSNLKAGKRTERTMRRLKGRHSGFSIEAVRGKEEFGKRLKEVVGKEEVVGVMGGDGTINQAVQFLAHSDTRLGIIPTGHGNDFAREAGIPMDPEKALELLINKDYREKSVDLGKVNDYYFCNSLGIGFDAEVVSESLKGKNYRWTAFKKLLRPDNFQARGKLILEDGSERKIDGRFLMLTFANGRTEGGGFTVNKGSDLLLNGNLGFTAIRSCGIFTRALTLSLCLRGELAESEAITHRKTVGAKLEFTTDFIHIDGEVLKDKNAKIKIFPGALKVLSERRQLK